MSLVFFYIPGYTGSTSPQGHTCYASRKELFESQSDNTNNYKDWSSYKNNPDNQDAINACIAANNTATDCGLVSPGTPWAGTPDCPCTEIMTATLFIQIFVSAEILIFPMRTLGLFFRSVATPWLYVSVLGACIVFTVLVAEGVPSFLFVQKIGWANAGYAWALAVIGMIILDLVKLITVKGLEGSTEEIPTEMEVIDAGAVEAEKQQSAQEANEYEARRTTAAASVKPSAVNQAVTRKTVTAMKQKRL